MINVILEGLVMSFWLLIVCVVGTANGPVGMVFFYEKDVQERVVELGLMTEEKIKKRAALSGAALWLPVLAAVPAMVYGINGARGFFEGFWQISAVYLIMGTFDRFFIDWYWVSRTKAWLIPGTEDLKPYIPKKTLAVKFIGTYIGFPLIAAAAAGVAVLLERLIK